MFSSTLQEFIMSAQNIIITLFASWTAFLCFLLLTAPLKYIKMSRWFSAELFQRVLDGKSTIAQIVPSLIARNLIGTAATIASMYYAPITALICFASCVAIVSVVARIKLGKDWMWKLADLSPV